VNTLRFNAAASSTVGVAAGNTLTLSSGGLLISSNVGTNISKITGGTLTSGNGFDLIFHQNNSAGTLAIESIISGNIGLTKSGDGTLVLSAANTYNGPVYIYGGGVRAETATALGTAGPVTVNRATLELADVTITPNLTLNDGARLQASGAGSFNKSGFPSIGAAASVEFSAPLATDTLTVVSSVRNGAGGTISVSGNGTVTQTNGSTGGDAFSGTWFVHMGATGVFKLSDAPALGNNPSAPATAIVASGQLVSSTGVAITNPITLAGGSLGATGATSRTFGGPITLKSSTTSTLSLVDPSNGTTARSLQMSGAIGGSGHLNIAGAGTATLTADSNYTGETTIQSGKLALVPVNAASNNNISNSARINVASGGTLDVSGVVAAGGFKLGSAQTLAGTGNVDGDVTVDTSGAAVAPGQTGTPGNLTLRNNFSLSSGKLAIESDGASFALLTVHGSVALGGTLHLKAAYQPALDAPITIVNKVSAGAVSGIFAGLAEEAYFQPAEGLTGDWYKISYLGGNGNDIVISRQAVPEPASTGLIAFAAAGLLTRRRRTRTRQV
jgi:autotransporter-associated beta strand protein